MNRVAQEVLTLLVGGSATTARVMTTLTFHLASEPAIVVRLREELNTIMPDPSVIPNLEQLESLKYLVRIRSHDQPTIFRFTLHNESYVELHDFVRSKN